MAHTYVAYRWEYLSGAQALSSINQGSPTIMKRICIYSGTILLLQALQSKHDALLQRVDELDNDSEELRDRVLDVEGERDELQGVMEDLQTEKTKLSEELDSKQVIMAYRVMCYCAFVNSKLSVLWY